MVLEWALATGFSVLLALSLLREVKKIEEGLSRMTLFFQYIPKWSFFAPIPNSFDYHIHYRTSRGFSTGPWQKADHFIHSRTRLAWLWNPKKKISKALIDVVTELINLHGKCNRDEVLISLPYLHILHFLDGLPSLEREEEIQFMVLANSAIWDDKVLFVSERHKLSKSLSKEEMSARKETYA